MNDLIGQAKLAINLQPTCNQLATDTISRQAAIDAVSEGCQEWRGIFDRCQENLLALPSAERKTGRWITKSTNGEMFDVCSACGYVEWDTPRNFCPNCGADMRGEEDETD